MLRLREVLVGLLLYIKTDRHQAHARQLNPHPDVLIDPFEAIMSEEDKAKSTALKDQGNALLNGLPLLFP